MLKQLSRGRRRPSPRIARGRRRSFGALCPLRGREPRAPWIEEGSRPRRSWSSWPRCRRRRRRAQEPEAYDWSYVPTDETYEWTYAAVPPKKKKMNKKEKKAKKAQDAIDNLARRLDAARARAAIQDVLKVDLQKERLAKLEELAAQEAEADQRHKDRQRAKAARVDTHQSECSSLERAVASLTEERSQLEIEVGDVDLRQDINERLREEVGTVRREMDAEAEKREVRAFRTRTESEGG